MAKAAQRGNVLAMTPEEFRTHAHAFVDWMADYLATLEARPVRAQTAPGEILGQLPGRAPEAGEPIEAIFKDFQNIILPGITHWQHPNFFAYFSANASPPSVLAEMLTATLAAQCMLWETSPAANELETRTLTWLRELIGLPPAFTGCIQDSASTATLCALIAARERARPGAARTGLSGGPPLMVYTSEEAHSSVDKAVRIAGLGADNLRLVPADESFAMRVDALQAAIAADRAAGRLPCAVVATLGTTGVGGMDRLAEIGPVCERENVFLHVDAAWAGSAFVVPGTRGALEGVGIADSFVFNPHKWLLTQFDCSAHYMQKPEELAGALSVTPAYLQSEGGAAMPEYRDMSIALGRRFRALKLWFVLRSYGAEGLRTHIRNHIAWTEDLAETVRQTPGFELVTPPSFGLLTFRAVREAMSAEELDRLNERLLARINEDGRLYLTKTMVRGRTVLRFAIGGTYTTQAHVRRAWEVIQELAKNLHKA